MANRSSAQGSFLCYLGHIPIPSLPIPHCYAFDSCFFARVSDTTARCSQERTTSMTATPVLHLMGCTQTHHVFAYSFTFVTSSRSGLCQVVKAVVDENFRGGANEGKSSRLLHPLHICIFLIRLSFPFRLNAIFAASAHRGPADEVVVDNRAVGPERLSFIWASILKVSCGSGDLDMTSGVCHTGGRLSPRVSSSARRSYRYRIRAGF